MNARKKPQLITPPAKKINTKSRSEALHGDNAKGSSAMGSGQNTVKRISGVNNHMRVKEVVDRVKISAPEQVRLDLEKNQTLPHIGKVEKKARAVQIGQIGMGSTFIMGPKYKRKEAINTDDSQKQRQQQQQQEEEEEEEEEEDDKDLVTRLQQPTPLMADEAVGDKSGEHEQQQEEEEDVEEKAKVEEVAHNKRDNDEHAIVRVKKFEGCYMLAKVDMINDHGVASRTRQRKTLRRRNSQSHNNNGSKGTFTDPIYL